MDSNIYRPPTAELQSASAADPEFYLVSPFKFLTLYLATLGLYGIYWFYRHWRSYRDYHGAAIWPLPRAIFAVIFAYPLFRRILARTAGPESKPRLVAAVHAALYVIFEIVTNLVDLLANYGLGELPIMSISLACMVGVAIVLLRMQIQANLACGDAAGAANSRFSGLNLLWILLGLLSWLMIFLGLSVLFGFFDPLRLGIYPGSADG